MIREPLGRLLSQARRVSGRPPSFVVRRVFQSVRVQAERFAAPRRSRALTPARLCRLVQARDVDELWARCAAGPWPLQPESVDADELERLCPGEVAAVVAAAERALAREVDFVGSGPLELGPDIDWFLDHKSGRRWPPDFSRAIRYANLGEPSDVKIPWEISRFQWVLPLGQAWLLTGDERYAEGARDLIDDWIASNPYSWTVNWACAMGPAIRSLALTWLFSTLHDSPAFADRGFRFRLLKSLYLHGDFIERHFERSDVNGNHFVAEAAGLVFVGLFFGRGRAPRRWVACGLKDLSDEVVRQVGSDGVDFEGSVPYHRLVCELFALPAILAEARGHSIPHAWRERLRSMAHFTASYCRPDGSSPLWGDADDGRALPMRQGQLGDHRYLVGLVGDWLDDDSLRERFSGPVAELYWLRGSATAAALAGGDHLPAARSEAFAESGYYILGRGDDHVFVDCGPVGMAGRGGHGHNDVLAFEAMLAGELLVTDRGCYVYTASVEERNEFRSTAAHNTPRVDEEEINRFGRPEWLWSLRDDTDPLVREWVVTDSQVALTASHDGYQRLPEPLTVVRRFVLESPSRLTIDDTFEGRGEHRIEVPLHLAPGVTPDRDGDDLVLSAGTRRFRLSWAGDDGWELAIEPTRVSPSYGVAVASTRLIWRRQGAVPSRLSVRLERSP